MSDPLIGQTYLVPQDIGDMKSLHFIKLSDRGLRLHLYQKVEPAVH